MQSAADRDFHSFVDELASRLAEAGMTDAAKELHTLLHETAWTTSSELLGELRAVFVNLKTRHHGQIPSPLLKDIKACIKALHRARNKANEG